jgi:hypothetical protein
MSALSSSSPLQPGSPDRLFRPLPRPINGGDPHRPLPVPLPDPGRRPPGDFVTYPENPWRPVRPFPGDSWFGSWPGISWPRLPMPQPWPPRSGGWILVPIPWHPMPWAHPFDDALPGSFRPCGLGAAPGEPGASIQCGQPSASFDLVATGSELQLSTGSATIGYRNPLGDFAAATVKGPAFEAGTAGFSASLGNVEGQFGAPIFGGDFTASANTGLDASAHLWTGQRGQYGAEVLGLGGNVHLAEDQTCVTLGTPILEATGCLSDAAGQGIAGATSDFMNDVSRGFDAFASDPIGPASTLAGETSDWVKSIFR